MSEASFEVCSESGRHGGAKRVYVDSQTSNQVPQTSQMAAHLLMSLDPRLLEKPSVFAGEHERWKVWRAKIESYLTGIDGRYEQALKDS